MDSVIQGQLDRIDAALNSLVESIASYNPSVTAANDLLAADDELCKGVKTRMLPTSVTYFLACPSELISRK